VTRIGVGYDGGPESAAALALAQTIARDADAAVEVRVIVDDRMPPIGWSSSARGRAVARWEDAVLAATEDATTRTPLTPAQTPGRPARSSRP
jgi:hypothetical protein